MPVYALYAIYTYAAAHGIHDLYRIGRWGYNKAVTKVDKAVDKAAEHVAQQAHAAA